MSSYFGFTKSSGPAAPPSTQPTFGNLGSPTPPSPPNPPFSDVSPMRSPPRAMKSPPSWGVTNNTQQRPTVITSVASRNSGTSVTLKASRFQNTEGINLPCFPFKEDNSRISNQDFTRNLIPVRPRTHEFVSINNNHGEGFRPPFVGVARPTSSLPAWDGQNILPRNHANFPSSQGRPFVASIVSSYDTESRYQSKLDDAQVQKRTRSIPLSTTNEVPFENCHFPQNNFKRNLIPVRPRTHEFVSINNNHGEGFRPPFVGVARPTSSLPAWDGQNILPRNHANFPSSQGRPFVASIVSSYDTESRYQSKLDDAQVQKRTRSIPLSTTNEVPFENCHFPQNNFKRSNVSFTTPDSQGTQRSPPPSHKYFVEATALNPSGLLVTKRTRSPPLLSRDQSSNGNSYTSEDGTEREQQAKARRLARFKVELSENVQGNVDATEAKVSASKPERFIIERSTSVPIHSTEETTNLKNVSASSEYEGIESSSVIIGLCTDMCPKMERGERERKGDLDQYEWLDGDRNQTSKYLAVKKYTRTAEREAHLIRPMPILQKTIDYLLNLLDQPYNEKFLGMYNFLWDRMRAIRMDLRMQHIFNQEAITMLEQMIRLHIIAMHELCEYSKGEGFSEGFDAHLNIEQMNKTSAELFQMYDDHRKKGINIPTEKEFRGYYALLKLDKHPGCIVEPAELSLDLAKMTSEIRQTKEVLFARDVARACRTGNFIAFFRLARKASYLQACLMHAHFAKLRTQALASLHAGLQNNQGLPVSHASKWLAMEEEDMESLLDYHRFLIKVYEEPYMVKDGPFFNGDKDYPTRRSKLVNMKKSGNIMEDVFQSTQVASLPTKEPNEIKKVKITKSYQKGDPSGQTETFVPHPEVSNDVHAIEKEMSDSETITSLKEYKKVSPITETPGVSQQDEEDSQLPGIGSFSWGFSLPMAHHVKDVGEATPSNDTILIDSSWRKMDHHSEGMALQVVSKTTLPEKYRDYATENSMPQNLIDRLEEEESPDISQQNETDDIMMQNQLEEIAEAKLKLILRLWKRRSSNLRELREQRQLAASAALNSLSLGPPIQLRRDQPSASCEFDIDQVLGERCKRLEKSWSEVNVSEEIAGTLSKRNPDVQCLCWKIVVCSQMNNIQGDLLEHRNRNSHLAAASWLHSKLMPAIKNDGNLLISSSGLAIWKKWVSNPSGTDISSCFSVVKDSNSENVIETMSGASALLFLVSGSIPWKFQKEQLHKLLTSIHPGSCLPLLILSASYKDEVSDASVIFDELSLHDIGNSRISSFKVVPLIENEQIRQLDGFFSDKQLREGLRWLASESPLQLKLYHMKTRDLVLIHLNSSLDALDRMNDHEVSANACVSAFNEALDQSLVEIITAAKANPINWPCPEITFLEDLSNEHRILKANLPSIGWRSSEKIAELVSAVENCKLPIFPDDFSCLSNGSNTKSEIENHRREVEHSLIRFLSQSSKIMGLTFAAEEAHVVLQRCSQLELRDSRFYIVPKWVMIFRRIFNWRLTSLTRGAISEVYILEPPIVTSAFDNLDDLATAWNESSAYCLNHPSLDEMIEMVCNPLHRNDQPLPGANQFPLEMVPSDEACEQAGTDESMDDEPRFLQDGKLDVADETRMNYESNNTDGKIVTSTSNKEAGKLSIMLEKCNIIQNKIEEKLSIYF